jgi:tetratricopeptide (TPR) repeat protein
VSFNLLPNITLILAVAGLLVLVGRRIPEAKKRLLEEPAPNKGESKTVAHIVSLHLPSRLWAKLGFWVKRFWHFLLEAKDIKKPATVGYKIKKMLPKRKIPTLETLEMNDPAHKDEQYYLQLIKNSPKDLELYNQLGKFYTDSKRYQDSRDIYLYLVKRDPGNATFYARLAFASYKLGQFQEAVGNYEKSLALDSAQPNRYYNLALSLEALGKNEEALVPIQKALELEPENKKYGDLLSSLQAKAGIVKEET